ncbi:hypothetical protein FJY71_01375, partial [candidate division WOR-3 bacterium]|nr:hypothetical protein [candidate division WOR-3 bacterium]
MGQAAGRFPTAAHRAPPAAARSSSLSLLFSLFALHSSLFALGLRALPGRPLVLDASSDRYASEFVFVATRAGIYSFDRNSQVWGRQNPPESLRRWDGRSGFDDEWWDFRALGLDDGIVWVATDDGLASADVRVADWRTYHLPGRPAGFAFTDDYVWAGSDSGLLRFDKYAETWEAVSTLPVRDLLADRGGVWAATDSGVLRYNPEFDRLEPAAAHPARYDLVVATPARVWFLGPDRLAAFSRAGENWTTYPGLDVADWSALGDSLFVVAGGRALLYDPRADNWAEFRDVPGLGRVNGLHAGAARLLLATDQGLLACNWADRTRTTWNRSTGLGSDTVVDVYEDGQSVFAVTARSIEVLDKTTEAWKPEPLTRMTSRPRLVFLDETGGHLRLFPQTDVRLSGRGHYSTTAGLGAGPLSRTEYENVNLTLAARHNSGRSLSLYYDDSDKDEIMYGVGYRGVGADALARADAGFLVTDFFEFDLVPRFSTFGGSARLKWRAHGLGLQAGRLQSRLRTDFFTGRSRRRQRALDAAGFSRDVFFRIPASGRSHLSDRSDTVFVDDRSAASDTVDTRRGITLAGIRGDFDPLIRGLDYHVDDSRSIIQFTSARRSTDVIVLVSPAGEQAVQSDSVRGNALDNVYALGPGVIPGTIELAAFDDAGAPLDLHGFGLDDDRDGRVDDACLNCDLGLLVVPNPRPFPRPGNGPAWTMEAAWETRSTTYSLSGRPVVKSSETVRVDGEPLARGSDYVIDYSSGDMVLLREGLVSEFSQVEIQYSSVDRPGSSKCWSAQPVARVAPGLELAPGLAAFDSSRFGLLAARFEASGDRRSIRFVPQVALDTKLNWAQDYSLTAGWGILGLNAAWRGYSAGFQHFGTAARRYGSLAGSGEVAASVEPVTGLRFGAGLRQEDQRDSILTSDGDSAGASFGPALNPCSYTWARAGYSRPGRPAASLLLGRDHLPERSRDGVKLTLGHDLTLARTRLKLGGVVRSDRISAVGSASALDYSLSANLALPV